MENEDKQDDRNLFRQLAQHSDRALNGIYDKFNGVLTNYIRQFIRDDEELIKEIISDVLLTVWKHRETLVNKQNPEIWMLSVARNIAISKFRARHEPLTEPLDEHLNLAGSSYADDRLDVLELEELIMDFAANLPLAEQEVFLLNKIEGLSNEEITLRLRTSRQTVKNQLSRALTKLHKHLEELGY